MPEHSESAGSYVKDEPLKLFGGDGTGEPIFSDTEICFNGDRTSGMDHETFVVTPDPIDFEFCKTARKPYDLMVCAVLISMKKHLVNFSYSSDGDAEDWAPAQKFYKSVIKTPKKAKEPKLSTFGTVVDSSKYPLLKQK